MPVIGTTAWCSSPMTVDLLRGGNRGFPKVYAPNMSIMLIKLKRLSLAASSIRHALIQWRLANPAIRTILIGIGTTGLALGIFGAVNAIDVINATAASVLVAVVFGVVTIFQQRQSQRRQHTVDLLTEFLSADRISTATAWLADRRITQKPVTKEISASERSHVIAAFDYYELIATLALRGLVDVRIVVDLAGASMARDYESCRSYIEHRRVTDAPNLYREIEVFLARYSLRKRALVTVFG